MSVVGFSQNVTLQSADKKLSEGLYYEAHQVYKTIYFRYLKKKQWGSSLFVTIHGAKSLFKHNQNNSGFDLALLALSILIETHAKVTEDNLEIVQSLYSNFPSQHSLKVRFEQTAIKWTQNEGEYTDGNPTLHFNFGMTYYDKNKFEDAQNHFLKCHYEESIEPWTNLLINQTVDSSNNSIDCLLTDAILKLLSRSDLKRANLLYSHLVNSYPTSIVHVPLIQFCELLLQTCKYAAPSLFRELTEYFSSYLKKVNESGQNLKIIGQLFFDINPQHGINDILKQMMGI